MKRVFVVISLLANDGTSDIKNINSFDNVLYMILYGEK